MIKKIEKNIDVQVSKIFKIRLVYYFEGDDLVIEGTTLEPGKNSIKVTERYPRDSDSLDNILQAHAELTVRSVAGGVVHISGQ